MASLVYAEGTSKSESLSLGGGGVVGNDDVTPFLGGGNSFSTQQTELAKLAAPPEVVSFRAPKRLAPITIGYYKKAAILFLVGIVGMIVFDSSDSLFLGMAFFVIMFTSIVPVTMSVFSPSARAEAIRNEEAKKQARREWEDAEKKKQADYKNTKFCLRCGEMYLSE